MKNFQSFIQEGYVASADKKVGKDGKLRPAKHIKTTKADDEQEVVEKMDMKKAKMGDVIKDFQDSDAPQFKGKSKEKRREMAIAAKLQAEEMEATCGCGSDCKHCGGNHKMEEVGKECSCCGNEIKAKDMKEELKGNQHKLDKNKNGKLDAADFKALRKEDMTPAQKAKRLEMIRKIAQKQNAKAERDAKRAMRNDPDLGRRPVDEENIDELKRDTIASYSKKAVNNAADASNRGDVKTVDKRIGGIKMASKKLDQKKLGEDHTAVAMGKMMDDEGSMALSQMDQMERAMKMVRDYIGGDAEKQLPAWVQSKITLAAEYIDTVGNYLTSNNEKVNEQRIEEDTHVVMYHDKDGKHVNNSKPMTADKAKAHAEKGNKIDKVGGKYIVKKINEADNPPFTPDPPKKNAKPQRNSDGSITSPMSKAKQLAKQGMQNAKQTVAQHKEGVEFDSEGNLLEAKNKITFHQFMGATKKRSDKEKKKESENSPNQI